MSNAIFCNGDDCRTSGSGTVEQLEATGWSFEQVSREPIIGYCPDCTDYLNHLYPDDGE